MNGFFVGPTLFDRMSRPTCKLQGKKSSARCSQMVRAGFRGGARASQQASIWQWRRDLHPQWPCGAQIRQRGLMSAWSASMYRSGAGRLSHIRWLEALGVWRHQPARHGGVKFWTKVKTSSPSAGGWLARRQQRLHHPDDGLMAPRMSQFDLTEDQRAIPEMAQRFTADVITPMPRNGTSTHFPRDVVRRQQSWASAASMSRRRWRHRPRKTGGGAHHGGDGLWLASTLSAFISIHNMAAWMIDAYGDADVKARYLHLILWLADGWQAGLTEPSSGSGRCGIAYQGGTR